MKLITKFLQQSIIYSGKELRSHWVYEQIREFGSAIVAFHGPCNVATSELVDLEDASKGEYIAAENMLHFIGEFFGESLEVTVLKQRLFAATCVDVLRKMVAKEKSIQILREGDDIFLENEIGRKKMSVSIATASPVSTLLHFGINIDARGAPVAAAGLNDLSIPVEKFVNEVFLLWLEELRTQEIARAKVLARR